MKLSTFLNMVRFNFIPASVLPFSAGAVLAVKSREMVPLRFLLGLAGVVFAHMAGNTINNYYDYKSGADSRQVATSPFFGGSKVICLNLLTAREVCFWGFFFLALSGLFIIGLTVMTQNVLFVFLGIFFLFLTVQYTGPPMRLAYRAWGEVLISFLFGFGIVNGGYYVVSQSFSVGAFLLSLPFTFLIFSVILMNELPDVDRDLRAGKKNLVSTFGREKAAIFFAGSILAAIFSQVVIVFYGLVEYWTLAPFFFYPLVFYKGIRQFKSGANDMKSFIDASAYTVFLHFGVSLAIIAGLLF